MTGTSDLVLGKKLFSPRTVDMSLKILKKYLQMIIVILNIAKGFYLILIESLFCILGFEWFSNKSEM